MVKGAIGGVDRDYLLLEYKGDDKLYDPTDQIDAVRHYTGGDSPALSRLGCDGWQKAKAKVRSVVSEIAQELVVLYPKRLAAPSQAFAEVSSLPHEHVESFSFQDTTALLTTIPQLKGALGDNPPLTHTD